VIAAVFDGRRDGNCYTRVVMTGRSCVASFRDTNADARSASVADWFQYLLGQS